MAPSTSTNDDSSHTSLLDKLDMTRIHKPFRNPAWKPAQRRNKTVKQIISEANKREQQAQQQRQQQQEQAAAAAAERGESLADATPAEAVRPAVPAYSYTSLAAAPSFKPKTRYCDLTGLPAPYQDPKTGLRYRNGEMFAIIKSLNTAQVQEHLALRNANTVLK